jgi:hypothetical protein
MAALKHVGRFLTSAILIIAVTCVVLLVVYPTVRRVFDNPLYADTFFSQILSEYEVVESRRWHPFWGEPFDCSYAVVRINETAPATPPKRSRDEKGWEFAYGDEWQPTPAPSLGDTTRDAIDFCQRYWESDVTDALVMGLASPGGWYSRDAVGETVDLYAPAHGIAAHIRYGD